MSQVLIVSNRLPVSVKKEDGQLVFSPSLGGLATGLASYARQRNNKWVGWPGIADDDLTEADREAIVHELAKHNCSPVFLTKKQINEYYNGFSNDVLWPLFHELPFKLSDQHKRWWRTYQNVNRLFTETVMGLLEPNGRVWVHDYQLLLLPGMLRDEDIAGNIGFFLHIPFPPDAIFRMLPEYRTLIKGLLGADLIGFHTKGYVNNFLDVCSRLSKLQIEDNCINYQDRSVRVGDFPMGIDYGKYAAASESQVVRAAAKRYKRRYRGKRVIAAVDRLDPSKGLIERVQAYQQLLEQNPKLHGKVVLAMIAAPSRTEIVAYQRLAKQLQALVDEINDSYGTRGWLPVDYMNTAKPFEEVAALFSIADVAFIAPIKDGMNLAAKEYVASKSKRGVLVLSETAGAAEELRDALLVNPLRPGSLVDGLQKALDMPRVELRSRFKRMKRQLADNTVQHWAKSFVDTLQKPVSGTPAYTRSLPGRSEQRLLQDYIMARKRLLLLDYDGTLTPFTKNYKDAEPPKSLLALLDKLDDDERNEVVLISGRSADDLQRWFGSLRLSLVAEHGAMVKRIGSRNWQTLTKSETRWKRATLPTLEKYTDLTPGAKLEDKPHSLVWHYRNSPPYYAQKYAVTIKRLLKPIVKTYGLKIFQGNKILEIKDPRVTKGSTALRWLRHRHDFILAMGDDFTDEELFAVVPDDAYSIKVGRGRTKAHYRLATPKDARDLLSKLSKLS